MSQRLSDRTAIVTGAGNSIGQAIALAMAGEGARVAVTDVAREAAAATVALIEAAGGKAAAWQLDVTAMDDVDRVVPEVNKLWGRLDVLVNNAGGTEGRYGSVLDTSPDHWDRLVNLNLKSTYLMCRAVLPHMIERSSGSIVNIASVGALVAGSGFAVYGAVKAGVVQLTRAIAVDFAEKGVRANVICPGSIETAAMTRMFSKRPDPDDARRHQSDPIPLGRMGRPDEIGKVAVFLAPDDASYVTGSIQVVDGGYSSAAG